MALSERLRAIISMVPRNKCTADIGTDHGFVPVSLVTEGIAERAIASDIGKGPLLRAEEHIRRAGLEDRIECRLGDGLSVLSPGEAEVLVIAGMGGMLMVRILEEGLDVAKSARTLILSPHRDAYELRKFLFGQGFSITGETMVQEDGKYYTVIRAEHHEETAAENALSPDAERIETSLSEEELHFGPVLLRERPAVFLEYLEDLEQKLEAEIRHLEAQKQSEQVLRALKEKREELAYVRKAAGPEETGTREKQSFEDASDALKIRRMTEDDLEPLSALLADPEVMRYLEAPYRREQTEAFLHRAGLSDPPLVYAAEEGGCFIGYVIFHDYDEESMEIGWVLQKDCWGRRIAFRLTEMLIEKGLSLGKDLVVECDPEQVATARIARKYGFTEEGMRDGLRVFRLKRLQV